MLETLFTDLRDATRTFLRMPGFTLVAVLTLALGIGINTTVFTVINAVLFKGYPFVDENERVLYVERPGVGFSYREFEDWRARATSFEGMAAATAWLVNFGDATGVPERTAVTVMGPEGFRLIGQKPFIGRDFLPSDGAPGAEPVAIVSHALWARRYGADPGVIGRTVKLDASGVSVLRNGTATVIGVMAVVYVPFRQDPDGFMYVFARSRVPPATLKTAFDDQHWTRS